MNRRKLAEFPVTKTSEEPEDIGLLLAPKLLDILVRTHCRLSARSYTRRCRPNRSLFS